jgi:predicted nucleic acid-binding protein
MLIDTDVLIDFLRGRREAIEFLERHVDDLQVSAVTVAELYQGVREGHERTKLATTLSALTVLALTEEIAELAGLFRRDCGSSMGCGLADCMIAATAFQHQLQLVTLNARHFGMLQYVIVPYHKA